MLEEMPDSRKPLVGVVMGSRSDWETMQHACAILEQFNVAYEKRVTSAHRTPDLTAEYGRAARSRVAGTSSPVGSSKTRSLTFRPPSSRAGSRPRHSPNRR